MEQLTLKYLDHSISVVVKSIIVVKIKYNFFSPSLLRIKGFTHSKGGGEGEVVF